MPANRLHPSRPTSGPVRPRLRRHAAATAMVAALVAVANVAPAVSAAPTQDPTPAEARARQDEIRSEKARLAEELEPLKATQAEMEQALAVLDEQVRAQQARADDARRAADDARQRAEDLLRQQLATEHQIDELQGRLQERAVSAYVNPDGRMDDTERLLSVDDISELDRDKALLDAVSGSTEDITDQLRGRKEELADLVDEQRAAQAEAEEWQATEEAALRELQAAEENQQRIKTVYDEQVRGIDGHIAGLSAEEAEMEKIITDAEARAAAQAEADRRANAALSGGSSSGGSSSSGGGEQAFSGPSQITGTAGPGGCIWPLPGAKVSRGFGGGHPGIDMYAPHGSPIYASVAGEVIFAGWNSGGYGNLVLVDHGSFVTAYAHQSQVAVSVGQQVGQGQLVGYEGSTGYSTGPHLHFEVRVNGSAIDPDGCLGTST